LLKISDPIAVSAVAGTGASSAVVDYYTRRIPNSLTLGVAGFGVGLAAFQIGTLTVTEALLASAQPAPTARLQQRRSAEAGEESRVRMEGFTAY
jgi:hypothetical protein